MNEDFERLAEALREVGKALEEIAKELAERAKEFAESVNKNHWSDFSEEQRKEMDQKMQEWRKE